MFDFNYNENVGFVPYVSVMREKAGKSSEEIEETKKAVETLSETVATQSESVAENSAAIADNTSAIASNTSAIADETAAREAAVEELNEKISEVPKFKIEVVDSLPAEGDSATIYLLKVSEEAGNLYEEYIYSNGAWEKLGPMVDLSGYATKDEMEAAFAGVYTKDEVDALIAPLAVQADVDAALALKADADSVYTKDEADAKFLTEHQDISGLASKTELEEAVAPLAVKSAVDEAINQEADERAQGDAAAVAAIGAVTTALDAEVTAREEALQAAEAKDAEQDAEIAKKVEWVESVPGRNHIVLKNHDNILGTAQDGTTYNLAMVSKWDVADFGTSSLHTNLNSLDGVVTINDNKQIATVDQLPVVDDFATKAEVEEAVSAETVARMAAIAELHEEIVALPKFKILIVDELPAVGDTATFYLLATGDEQGNVYTEYVYVNGAWEEIGTQSLDLSEYAKTADVDAAFATVNDNMDTLSGVVETLTYEFESVDEKLAGLAEANAEQDAEIALKAYAADVYTKAEADAKFLTEHQDISALATKAEVEAVDAKVDAIVIPDLTPYALAADVTAEIAAATGVLAAKDVEQDEAINEINSGLTELAETKADKAELEAAIAGKEAEIYNLTKIVGDLGGAVTYELPGENGKSFNTLMGNNGTVKLTDDVTTGRFGPGITAKNNVKLNLNGHDLTVTGLTTSSAQGAIMARGTQVITIGGKGTIDAGEGICIEGNGADSVINLTGSTSVYRTNRSGGELVYCYAGTINITNGTFRNDGEDKKYVLNCYDANYRNGTANIVVTGGKFYDFDPANNTAEGENTSFVPEGYESVPSVVVEDGVEHTVYTVKKSA